MSLMSHDGYLSRLESAADPDAPAILEHAESCAACRRDRRIAERSLAKLEPRSSSRIRLEDVASLAAVAAMLAIAIAGLSSWNGRSATPASHVARYRIVGGPAGVVAYTPTETIVASGGSSRISNESDTKEIRR